MIGILFNTCTIFIGGIIGGVFSKYVKNIKCLNQMLGITIMFMSIFNIIPEALSIENGSVESNYIFLIVGCLIVGAVIGEKTKSLKFNLDNKISGHTSKAFYTGTMLFGIGGLQFIGSINAIVVNDSSMLINKCFVDFPLAISFGAMMGAGIALSGFSVGIMQMIIGGIAFCLRDFFTPEVIEQLCVMGYIILFFVGFNMVFEGIVKVETDNMIPSILLVLIYNIIKSIYFI